jgi:undecaprenyl-diphosphatase
VLSWVPEADRTYTLTKSPSSLRESFPLLIKTGEIRSVLVLFFSIATAELSGISPPLAQSRFVFRKIGLSLLQILTLAVVQGLTEFLPISSSGHLILVPYFTGWPDQGLAIDVSVHVGTLAAVLIYFWRDTIGLARGVLRLFAGRMTREGRLALYLLAATIPAIAAGYALEKFAGGTPRRIEVVAWAMVIFAVVLWVVDRISMRVKRLEHMTLGQALVVGIAQPIAFIPGTSRSGITIVAARLMGYERAEAARFSFLLSIPAIVGAGLFEGLKLFESGSSQIASGAGLAALFSAITGLAAIWFLMRWLRRSSFTPFVIYRLILGIGLLVWLYG